MSVAPLLTNRWLCTAGEHILSVSLSPVPSGEWTINSQTIDLNSSQSSLGAGSAILSINQSFSLCSTWTKDGQAISSLWDVELGLQVASSRWNTSVTSTPLTSAQVSSLQMVRSAGDRVLVQASRHEGGRAVESSIHVLRVQAPKVSSLKAALDAAATTNESSAQHTRSAIDHTADPRALEMLCSLERLASQGDPVGMENLFRRWSQSTGNHLGSEGQDSVGTICPKGFSG